MFVSYPSSSLSSFFFPRPNIVSIPNATGAKSKGLIITRWNIICSNQILLSSLFHTDPDGSSRRREMDSRTSDRDAVTPNREWKKQEASRGGPNLSHHTNHVKNERIRNVRSNRLENGIRQRSRIETGSSPITSTAAESLSTGAGIWWLTGAWASGIQEELLAPSRQASLEGTC